jgi:hydroxymethylpyrimidine/phosphomethylpyrimidine kinase
LRTLAHFGTEALCALTAVTVQSEREVRAVHPLPAALVRAQVVAALETRRVGAIKIGMLASRAIVDAVAGCLPPRTAVPTVLDPVLAATSGGALLDADAYEPLREKLLPRATIVTPNIPEAALLLGAEPATSEEEMLQQAHALLALGPGAVLLKGGHGQGAEAVDVLLAQGRPPRRFNSPRSRHRVRGSGCALASGIAAALAAGLGIEEACQRAKRHVSELFEASG